MVSKDVRISVAMPLRRNGDVLNGVVVRGLSPEAFEIRPRIQIVEGRMFQTGKPEVIVGRRAQSQFQGTLVGKSISYNDIDFKIVGVFESHDWYDSGFICDANSLLRASGRGSTVHAMLVQLENPAAFRSLDEDLGILDFQTLREADYYDRLDDAWSIRIRPATRIITFIMAVGAVFCVFAVMRYASSARCREVVRLRRMGVGTFGALRSMLVEPILAAGLGALTGLAAAWTLVDGSTVTAGF